jgi:hypothetical protein
MKKTELKQMIKTIIVEEAYIGMNAPAEGILVTDKDRKNEQYKKASITRQYNKRQKNKTKLSKQIYDIIMEDLKDEIEALGEYTQIKFEDNNVLVNATSESILNKASRIIDRHIGFNGLKFPIEFRMGYDENYDIMYCDERAGRTTLVTYIDI